MKTLLSAVCVAAACSIAISIKAEETGTEVPHEHHEGCAHHTQKKNREQSCTETLNPEVSVFIDTLFYHENSEERLPHIKGEMPGFGHGHEDEGHDHGHGLENGFNLREIEVQFSGEVDGYFVANATLAFTEDDVEAETAEIETTSLPWGLEIKAGKFFSDFGIINAQHSHSWDFSDSPLIYDLALGDHGLNDIGIQASWHAPAPFYLHTGVEALQGTNEKMFAHEGGDELPNHDGPRLGVGWIKGGPQLGDGHSLQFGLFGGGGKHQEIHEETAGVHHYLDGTSFFLGGDAAYRYDAQKEHGQGDFTLQAEYFHRNKNLDLEASDDPGAPLGEQLDSNQDGYYVQALYGVLPRWRTGLRWDQVGSTNDLQEPGETREDFGASHRISAMVDFKPSTASTIRLQLSNGDYATEDGREEVWEGFVQLVVSFGSHHDHSNHHDCNGLH